MHQIQINVVDAQALQRRVNAFLDLVVPGVVELGGDPDLLAGHARVADAITNLSLVAVGKGSVDVTVALQKGVLDSLADLIGLRLPGAQTDGGDLVAGVESVGLPRGILLIRLRKTGWLTPTECGSTY